MRLLLKKALQISGPMSRKDFGLIIFFAYGFLFAFSISMKYISFSNTFILFLAPAVFSYILLVNSIKRIHDAGYSSLWLILFIFGAAIEKSAVVNWVALLLQVLAVIIPLVMLFLPPKLTNNKYK
jgi:uncharacterized membrane protein YhaH (DUF805 family)